MSHEVEAMMYVNEKPWHGLGKQLAAPPTIEEGITCAGLDWTVETKQLVMEDGLRKVPAFATVRASDGALLGVVGNKYKPYQNIDAFKWFQPWLDAKKCSLDTAGSLKGGTHVWVLARINRDPVEVVKGDPIIRYVLLSNSHDGSRMVRAGFTATRCVCWNTVSAALTSNQSKLLKIRHTANAEEALKKVAETMEIADRNFAATIEQMRVLARKGVTKETIREYVTRVFRPKPITDDENEAMTDEQEEKCERLVGRILPLFETGKGNTMPGVRGTMWAAYNAVTEYLTWERGRNSDNRMTSLWMGDGQGAAQRALSVAVKMMVA